MTSEYERRINLISHVKQLFIIALTALALSSLGCLVVPVPAPRRTRSASGEAHQLDLTFIQPGKTTHDEVAEKLAWMDTGCHEPRLFWGHWDTSRMAVMAGTIGGYGGGGRIWLDHNLVVGFDEKGIVQRTDIVSDKELNNALQRWFQEVGESSRDVTVPQLVEGTLKGPVRRQTVRISISIGVNAVQFTPHLGTETQPDKKWLRKITPNLTVLRSNVERIEWSEIDEWQVSGATFARAQYTTFHFREKTALGRSLSVGVNPPSYLLLYRYFTQTSTRK